jgi:glycosyltransferase involved in cell wall biosynthesis
MPSISYAITAHNEAKELKRLLNQIESITRPIDEIIIQLDETATEEVKQIAKNYNTVTFDMNGDFASFKNNLKNNCKCTYIFFIDASEYLSKNLINNLTEILTINEGLIDVIAIPRINTIEGLTRDYIDKWKLFVDEKGRINYPDYQIRLCVNKSEIKWVNKTNEKLSGWKTILNLPEGYELIYPKTI